MPDVPPNTEYVIESTSNVSARVEDVEIGRSSNGQTRKVLRAEVVENGRNPENTVKGTIVYQRRSQSVGWEDIDGVPLSRLRAGEAAKISLSSDETKALADHLFNLYQIGQRGVRRGVNILTVANEDAVIQTTEGRARLLRKIAESEELEELAEFGEEFRGTISEAFAVSRLHKSRQAVLDDFEARLEQSHSEDNWKQFLKNHNWIFGVSNIDVLDEERLSIHHETDIPFEVDGGFIDIVELKLPQAPLWRYTRDGTLYLYRSKFPVESKDFSEAHAQLMGYIFEAEKRVNDTDFIRDHGGKLPLKPRGLIVIGRSTDWHEEEWKAYRLLNDDLHGIQVITYDQLLERARRALELLIS